MFFYLLFIGALVGLFGHFIWLLSPVAAITFIVLATLWSVFFWFSMD